MLIDWFGYFDYDIWQNEIFAACFIIGFCYVFTCKAFWSALLLKYAVLINSTGLYEQKTQKKNLTNPKAEVEQPFGKLILVCVQIIFGH